MVEKLEYDDLINTFAVLKARKKIVVNYKWSLYHILGEKK